MCRALSPVQKEVEKMPNFSEMYLATGKWKSWTRILDADVDADVDMEIWMWSSHLNTQHVQISVHAIVIDAHVRADICGKNKPSNVDGSLYRVTKKYYLNKGSPDFHRLVMTMEGM